MGDSYESEKFQVGPFDINLIKPGHLIAVVGTNKAQSEAIIKQLTAHLAPKIRHVRVFSCSTSLNQFTSYIPATYINNYFDASELKSIYQKQKDNLEWCDEQPCSIEATQALRQQFSTLLIMDHCATDKNEAWFKDPGCNDIFQKHASNECTLIYRGIEMDHIPLTFKNHFDFCFVVSSSAAEEHSKVFNRFGGLAQSLATLRKAFTYNMSDTSSLVIMRASSSSSKTIYDEGQEWKKYFARYDPFIDPVSPSFRFGPANLWSNRIATKTHWKPKPQWEENEGTKKNPKRSVYTSRPSQSNPTIDEVLQMYAQHKRLRIEVLSDDEEEDDDDDYERYSS